MNLPEVEKNVFLITHAKLHVGMCDILSNAYSNTMNIFPAIEGALPRSRSGIQALCSLHIALEDTKNIIGHCSECSKLYLAVTGESVLLKFERAKCSLIDSLKHVIVIVPQSVGCQLLEIVGELEGATFALDPTEKKVGDDIADLIQKGRRFDDSNDSNEVVECFRKASSKLGINSLKAALREGKALRKLVEIARTQEDKQKESIVAYLLTLMNKYSETLDGNDSPGSLLRSPNSNTPGSTPGSSEYGTGNKAFGHQASFNIRPSVSFKAGDRKPGLVPVPPEELRCPISLQLMYDPVIISSGQTYEKKCIEKWFRDGHNTCPKTQQRLSHLGLTPNYCVKGLIASWCEQHGVQVPDGPPESLDLNYWRLALSDCESAEYRPHDSDNSHDIDNDNSHDVDDSCKVKVVGLEVTYVVEEVEDDSEGESAAEPYQESENNGSSIHENLLRVLNGGENLQKKCVVVEQIRRLLKEDEAARLDMGSHGFVEALVQFLKSAVSEVDEVAQEVGAMALFNIAVNNNRNKELMLSSELVPLLEEMIPQPNSSALVAALTLNLSCLEAAKPILGASSKVIPFLISLLQVQGEAEDPDPQSKVDALHAAFNLSTCLSNVPSLLQLGIVAALHSHLKEPHDHEWIEKSIAILINLAGSSAGKDAITSDESLIGELATILDAGEPVEQEQAAACLLILCDGSDKWADIALQEGVIPSLVCLSVNGTVRGRTKAQRLLMLFREQRKPEPPPILRNPQVLLRPSVEPEKPIAEAAGEADHRPLGKSTSTRVMGRTFSFFRKNRNQSTRK